MILNLSSFLKDFKIVESTKSSHGGNRHNYGIEWAESHLGSNIYNNYVNSMNYEVYRSFTW